MQRTPKFLRQATKSSEISNSTKYVAMYQSSWNISATKRRCCLISMILIWYKICLLKIVACKWQANMQPPNSQLAGWGMSYLHRFHFLLVVPSGHRRLAPRKWTFGWLYQFQNTSRPLKRIPWTTRRFQKDLLRNNPLKLFAMFKGWTFHTWPTLHRSLLFKVLGVE